MAWTLALLLFVAGGADGFTVSKSTSPGCLLQHHSSAVVCWAKKAAKGKKRKAPRGSGFGSTAPPAVVDDYAVFPRLEPNVQDTLVPFHEASDKQLPEEILEQIYGFPNFNYLDRKNDRNSISLTDMLSSDTIAPDASSNLSDMLGTTTSVGSSELDSLLASATGGKSPVVDVAPSTTLPTKLPLDLLPPFERVRVLHTDPLVVSIDDFFTNEECDCYVAMSSSSNKRDVMQSRSPTVGKDAAAKAQRTSTTWYHHFRNVPELMAKASRLLGLEDICQWEEPQTVRYRRNEKFTWHLDALGPDENQAHAGGQRIATLLVYLTGLEEEEGGATLFRDLGKQQDEPLRVQPRKGSALLFFPAAGGIPNAPFDIRTLHCGQVVADDAKQDKWIAQLWLRQKAYSPTAPPGNYHNQALEAVGDYCTNSSGS